MRIIAGKYRGKKLNSPKDEGVRPTSDRAREGIFNILSSKLGGDWDSYSVLDVFSGSGAFAFESLSRGVRDVSMIDINTETLLKNASIFPTERKNIDIIKSDVKYLPSAKKQYNLIFMDAPYNKGLSEVALNKLASSKWLENNAICIVEIDKKEEISVPDCFVQIDERIYGIAKIIFLEYVA